MLGLDRRFVAICSLTARARAEDLAHVFACLDLRVDVVVTFLTKRCEQSIRSV